MLAQFLISELFAFLLVFCRLGSAMMLLPGFGEIYIPVRVRLLLALTMSALLSSVLPNMPEAPDSVFLLAKLLGAEILIGIFMGVICRILVSAIHMAGMIIAYQSSLASALTQDVTQTQGQGTSLGNLLGFTALLLLFTTDMHHLMLRGVQDSYTLFLPGQFPSLGGMAQHASQSLSTAFSMAMQLSAPHLVIGLIMYLAAGIIARLMPNIQIFFIMLPPQLLVSFFILMVSISAILLWYMEYFQRALVAFLSPV
jgi:flagellar biosynthetic protein FliR